MKKINRPFLITGIILIITVAGFVYYYLRVSASISTVDYLNEQVTSLQNQLSSANSQVASLQSQVSSLQSQLSSANSQVSSLQSQLSAANSQISSLQTDVSSYKSQISSLQTQLSSGGSQITTLQEQISSLQGKITDLQGILSLSRSSTKAGGLMMNQPTGQTSLIVTFTADYAGYITVSGTSSTPNAYIKVTSTFAGYPDGTYLFGTGGSLTIPVLPGTVSVYFKNTNLFYPVIATITEVTYHY